MTMIKAISNTSPIIGLSMIGQLELLWGLFDIYIPQEVYNEVVLEGSENAIGKHFFLLVTSETSDSPRQNLTIFEE